MALGPQGGHSPPPALGSWGIGMREVLIPMVISFCSELQANLTGLSSGSEEDIEGGTCPFTGCPEALGPCEMSLSSLEKWGQEPRRLAPVGEPPMHASTLHPDSPGTAGVQWGVGGVIKRNSLRKITAYDGSPVRRTAEGSGNLGLPVKSFP